MRSPRIQAEARGSHVLTVMRYGDLNPVRARMVASPKAAFAWSSYRHYASGEPNPITTDEPEYLALGRARERPRGYRHLFATPLASGLAEDNAPQR